MRKIFSLFVAALFGMTMFADTQKIYCKVTADWWNYDYDTHTAVGAYAWGEGVAANAEWPGVKMTAVEGETDVWAIELDSKYTNIIFTRIAQSGEYKGVKTADLTIPSDGKNLYTITKETRDWDKDPEALSEDDGVWSVFEPTPVEPTAKFYITGDSALVVDAGLEKEKAWDPAAIESEAESHKLSLKANVAYKLKVTLDGTFAEGKVLGFSALTTVAEGLLKDESDNICFSLTEDGEVSVHYDGEYFFLNGKFYVAPAPEKHYFIKNNWDKAETWSWKELVKDDEAEEPTYVLSGVVFGGQGVNINTAESDEGAAYIEAKDIPAFDAAYEPATLEAGDKVVFVYKPESANSFTGEHGLSAIILEKHEVTPIPDPTVAVIGSMTDWQEDIPFVLADDKKSASLTDKIPAGRYEFKLKINGELRSNGYRFHREFTGAAGISRNEDANMIFEADVDGIYTFEWFFENDSLAITFPEKPVEPTAKFYVTGDAALVGEELAWNPAAIESMEESYVFESLEAGDYMLKITVDGTWSTVKGFDALTTVAEGLTRGEGTDEDNICFTLAEAGKVTVHYDGTYFFLTGNFYVEPTPAPKYFLKNNWDGAEEWTWKEMTLLEDNTYMLAEVVFGGQGVNINTAESDEDATYIEAKDITTFDAAFGPAELGALDTVVFFFDPEAVNKFTGENGLTAQIIGKYVAPQPELPYVALIGEMNNWDGAANPFEVAEDKLTASVTVSLEQNDNEGYAFKILVDKIGLSARGEEWYHINREVTSAVLDWAEENSDPLWLEVDQAGNYTFIWTYATKTLEVIFPDPTAVENAEVGEKASKIMINGQLFIIKGNKTYNGLGQVVK